jgi:hypothetical protein
MCDCECDKKKVTMDVVQIVAEFYMLDRGVVTAVDIKNFLLGKGYDTNQSEISSLLQEYYDCGVEVQVDECDWVGIGRSSFAGYYEYYFNGLVDEDCTINEECDNNCDDCPVDPLFEEIEEQQRVNTLNLVGSDIDMDVYFDPDFETTPREYIRQNLGTPTFQLCADLDMDPLTVRLIKEDIVKENAGF